MHRCAATISSKPNTRSTLGRYRPAATPSTISCRAAVLRSAEVVPLRQVVSRAVDGMFSIGVVTAATTIERLAPAGLPVARAIGAVVVFLRVRAA